MPLVWLVGILTARLQKQRYIQEDFISALNCCFGMAVLAETVTALQFSFLWRSPGGSRCTELAEIWTYHQRIALCSAILSSLWAPVVYYPSQSLVGANERFRAFLKLPESRRNTEAGEKELADFIMCRLVDDYYRECSTTPFRQK